MFISVPDIPHRPAPSFSWLSLLFHPNGNQGNSGKSKDPHCDGSTAPLHTHHCHQKPQLHISLGKVTALVWDLTFLLGNVQTLWIVSYYGPKVQVKALTSHSWNCSVRVPEWTVLLTLRFNSTSWSHLSDKQGSDVHLVRPKVTTLSSGPGHQQPGCSASLPRGCWSSKSYDRACLE